MFDTRNFKIMGKVPKQTFTKISEVTPYCLYKTLFYLFFFFKSDITDDKIFYTDTTT